ncbi:MAG: hypothetical protein QXZ68_08020 [Candidatus Bathyarchaeia archaeon]
MKRLLGLEELQQKRDRLADELHRLQNQQLSLIFSQWTGVKSNLEQTEKRLTQEEQAFKRLTEQIEAFEVQMQTLKTAIPKLQQEIDIISRRIPLREKRIESLKKEEQKLLTQLEELENKALTQGETPEFAKARNAYFEKQLALTVANMFLNKDKQTIANLQKQINDYQKEINRLQLEKPRLEQQLLEKHKTIESLKSWLNQLRKEEPELRSRKEALEKQAQQIQAELAKIEAELVKT